MRKRPRGRSTTKAAKQSRPPKTQRYPVFESDNDRMGFSIDSTAPGSPSVEAVETHTSLLISPYQQPYRQLLGELTFLSGSSEGESISVSDFGPEKLSGAAEFFGRHVVLSYKKPVRIEASLFRRIYETTRKSDMKKEVNICPLE
ncbi:hypothetical protein F2Q69_00014154 [Brassica cretica]|uniref:Uncharacterized protein n=1 Tax=Brassica cretica TaxID=69181 RepID=A0A8S9R7L0_BRACR|nr:hypothetical protein F2Q69_00014154 [Brassica cretica]